MSDSRPEVFEIGPGAARVERRCLIVGIAVLALAAALGYASPDRFASAYLLGYLFWAGIAVGCLGLLMLHHLAGGRWTYVVQRLLEAAARTLPLLALLFLPILLSLQRLYLWARPEAVAAQRLLQYKQPYLNAGGFFGRAVIYFAIWIALGWLLTMLSRRRDEAAGDTALTRRMKMLSGPGMLVYGVAVSFAAIDWAMSLEPLWFSSIYGIVFLVGQALTGLAFTIVIAAQLEARGPLRGVIGPRQWHDLGNLLLALVMLWAYIAFSQFLIIWSGNLLEEIPFYLRRLQGGWQIIAGVLIGFHFIVPFLLLLSRGTKRNPRVLGRVAAGLLVIHLLDLFWLTAPAFRPHGIGVHPLDLLVPIGLGGVWVAAFLAQLRRRPLLALNDPQFAVVAEPAEGH
ncbi:MAG TPA: hypothetical protein VMD08_07200 [Candidatus Baltobacteraceae bacterium]|nr:hypothetical protein [Candidatus Baltobacteraceae bacterium]